MIQRSIQIKLKHAIDINHPVLLIVDNCPAHKCRNAVPVALGKYGLERVGNLFLMYTNPRRTQALNVGDQVVNRQLKVVVKEQAKMMVTDWAHKFVLIFNAPSHSLTLPRIHCKLIPADTRLDLGMPTMKLKVLIWLTTFFGDNNIKKWIDDSWAEVLKFCNMPVSPPPAPDWHRTTNVLARVLCQASAPPICLPGPMP